MTEDSLKNRQANVVIALVPPSADEGALADGIARIVKARVPLLPVLLHPPCGPCSATRVEGWEFQQDARLLQDRAALAQSLGSSFAAAFEVARSLNAQACIVITSDLSTVTAEWIELLVKPVVEEGYDLVTPGYAPHPFEGVINRALVYPLMRALYGRRLRNPMGPDFGLSNRMLGRMSAGVRPKLHPLVSLAAEAIAADMRICQANLGTRIYRTLDWANLSPFLTQVLTVLFLDVERFAPWWQRARGSQAVPEFGPVLKPDPSTATVDPSVLIQAFQAGARTLIQTWGLVLPPSTLVELRKLAQQDSAHFRMPDEMWARIVFDFVLAHRVQLAQREQILKSFTPIYMAWVASYALEIAHASADAIERRIEELCMAFEAAKPYFVSRWRWPDRFNP